MPLKIIGAGLERTGTHSLKLALERLGFGPCHHMFDVRDTPRLMQLWTRVFKGEANLWDEIFSGFNATTDAPGRNVYRELADYYPDAKLILTVRDAGQWVNSMSRTILFDDPNRRAANLPPVAVNFLRSIDNFGRRKPDAANVKLPEIDPSRLPSREMFIERFNAWNEAVKRAIAPERLLVFDVKEGWAPLCDFLGVPIPDAPFPRTNSTEEFRKAP